MKRMPAFSIEDLKFSFKHREEFIFPLVNMWWRATSWWRYLGDNTKDPFVSWLLTRTSTGSPKTRNVLTGVSPISVVTFLRDRLQTVFLICCFVVSSERNYID
jgi:hypothetical protein